MGDHHRAATHGADADFFKNMRGNHHDLVAALSQLLIQLGATGNFWFGIRPSVGSSRKSQKKKNTLGFIAGSPGARPTRRLKPLDSGFNALPHHAFQPSCWGGPFDPCAFCTAVARTSAINSRTLDAHVAIAGRALRQNKPHLLLRLQCCVWISKAAHRSGSRRRGVRKPVEHLHVGGFARPIGPQKTEHFPRTGQQRTDLVHARTVARRSVWSGYLCLSWPLPIPPDSRLTPAGGGQR